MAVLAITMPNATAGPFFAGGHEAKTTKMVALSVEPMLQRGHKPGCVKGWHPNHEEQQKGEQHASDTHCSHLAPRGIRAVRM